jgi:hypothetical protein
MDFGQQAHVFITNAHQATLNMDLVSRLVQLSTTDYIGSEARNIVDVTLSTVFCSLVGKESGPIAFDSNDGTTTKPDSDGHASVKVIERVSSPCHVVRCTSVEDPPARVVIPGGILDRIDELLHQLNDPCRSR